MTTVSNKDHIAELGVLALRKACAKAMQICREVRFLDVGVDAFIELVDDKGTAEGRLIGVQVKTGASFVNDDNFTFSSDYSHIRYWSLCAFPMIAVIHDPLKERSAWLDLTEACTAERLAKNDYRFKTCFSAHPFNEATLLQTVIPIARRHFGRSPTVLPPIPLDPITKESKYETWFRLIGVLVGPATPEADAADAAYRLSRYMPTVEEEQRNALVAVIQHLTDFQLIKIVGAADFLLDSDGAFAQHVVDLLQYDDSSTARLESLLQSGAIPEQLRETAIQVVECLMQIERNDLRNLESGS